MRASKKLTVPDLAGLTLNNARLLLEILGFQDCQVRYEESYEPSMTVIDQNPGEGMVMNASDTLDLVVSQRSLVDYLPGIYRSSVYEGEYFLKNFLWIFRHIYDDLNEKIDHIPDLFSPYRTPQEFLPWLSRWVCFTLDENWPEEKKRYLLRRAVEYYKIRGTVKGLKLYISYFVGVEPEIIENEWPFHGFQIDVHSTMEIDSIIFPVVNHSHCFIVNVPLNPAEIDDQLIIKIHDIIRSEKPAHTMYFLRFEEKRAPLSEWQVVVGDDGGYTIGEGQELVVEDVYRGEVEEMLEGELRDADGELIIGHDDEDDDFY